VEDRRNVNAFSPDRPPTGGPCRCDSRRARFYSNLLDVRDGHLDDPHGLGGLGFFTTAGITGGHLADLAQRGQPRVVGDPSERGVLPVQETRIRQANEELT
jgi:hypothetical protein